MHKTQDILYLKTISDLSESNGNCMDILFECAVR